MQSKEKSWDDVWEKIFSSQEWGKYPPEELIRFIARNYYKVKDRKKVRILDLGCGTGAATWYIAREGFSAFGIEGSETAVKIAKGRFKREGLEGEFRVGDFINLDCYPDAYFDCVIDVTALQHNKIENIKKILKGVSRILKPDGKIFSMMINNRTKLDNEETSPFHKRGFFHLFDKEEIKNMFKDFNNLSIELSERTDRGNLLSHFVISAEKCKK
jgi:ubiquinone/menaquinone biosynthesis C-methylase UbiE